MSNTKAYEKILARRYGRVLFELVEADKNRQKVMKEIGNLSSYLHKEPQEWSAIASPVLGPQKQCRVLKELGLLLQLGNLLNQFLRVLCHYRRLPFLHLILEEFFARVQRAEGIMEGVIETPKALSQKEVEGFQKSLQSQLGKRIALRQEIHKNLLGGACFTGGNTHG